MRKTSGHFIPLTWLIAASILSSPALGATKMSYANTGAYNAVNYIFKAQNTGDIVAYFTGASAAYDSRISVLVNGVNTGVHGLDNHSSSIGQSIDLGSVKAGDKIVFVLDILGSSQSQIYSDATMNGLYDFGSKSLAGANHIYSTFYDGSDPALSSTPSGTSVSFEDLQSGHSDYDYNDETFVFTNVSAAVNSPAGPRGPTPPGPAGGTPPGSTSPGSPAPGPGGVPEPDAWLLMLIGFGGMGVALRTTRGARASSYLPATA